jgi:tyrosyl-tRNA synthetase
MSHQSTEANTNTTALSAHIGYFVPLTKIADFLRAGVEVSNLHLSLSALAEDPSGMLCDRWLDE